MYSTVKPTDDETLNKIIDFTQDLDYQFEDDRKNRHQLTRPNLLNSGLNTTSHKRLLDHNQSFERKNSLNRNG